MALTIDCPNCGKRPFAEFRFGGRDKTPPPAGADLAQWRRYLYFEDNRPQVQDEWWFHELGCGQWINLRRDTAANRLIQDGADETGTD